MAVFDSRRRGRQWLIWTIILSLALTTTKTLALSQQLCSSQNTGSDFAVVSDTFQSNGACSTTCAGHAFAVVQYQSCWCSDYMPADTTSAGSCSVPCPGYPYENCGDKSSGLFGYIALGKAPLGTQGGSSSNPPTQQATSTVQATQPSTQAVSTPSVPGNSLDSRNPLALDALSRSSTFPGQRPSLPFLGPPFSVPSTPNSFETQFLTPSVQASSNPVTIVNTVTAQQSTQVSFVSITPSTPSTTSTSSSTTPTPTLIPASITLNTPTTSTTPAPTTPTTTATPTSTIPISITPTSTISSTSSTWTPTPFMSVMTVTGEVKTLTVTPTEPPAAQTTIASVAEENKGGFWQNSAKVGVTFFFVAAIILAALAALIWFMLRRRRHSDVVTVPSTTGNNTPQRRPSRLSQMGLIGGTVQRQATVPTIQTSGWGPATSAEKSPADTLNADRRSSYPRVVDQRLEPTALWNPLHDNGSHISVRSFRDDQDYSRRMLRIANPDDEGAK